MRVVAVIAGLGWLMAAGAAGPDQIQSRLDEIARINVTEAWEESQAMAEQLAADMEGATADQRAQLDLLLARNLKLAGREADALLLLEPLLDADLPTERRMRAYEMAANYALDQLEYEQAFTLLRDSIALLPETNHPAPQARLVGLAAYFHSEVGEQEMAIDYAKQALALARASRDAREQCIALHRLALAQFRLARFADAEATHRLQMEQCEAADDPLLLASNESGLGNSVLRQGRVDEALRWIRSGLQRHEENGYEDGALIARRFLARALKANGEIDQAERILTELVAALERKQYWNNLHESLLMLTNIADARGDSAQALALHREAEAARSRWLEREGAMRLAYLRVEFDTRLKEQELALLREQNRVMQLEDAARNQQALVFMGGTASMGIIGLLLLLLLFRSQSERRRFRKLSEYDGLTGLYNHTRFFGKANATFDECHRHARPYTLIIADIDFFKQINDNHDHLFGDEVLRIMGARLREVFGKLGIVGRIGGEEFGIALPGKTSAEACKWIEKFRRIAAMVRAEDNEVEVTLSFGVAQMDSRPGGDDSLETLRRRADHALYEAKATGRNRVALAAATAVKDPVEAE
jgi:diguanylate cyclase (GGDEF)-like protein